MRPDGRTPLQLDLPEPARRRRKKRGRPSTGTAGVRHRRREHERRCPLHVTLKVRRHVYQLRSRRCASVIHRALLAKLDYPAGRIAQFSIQRDHVHLLVEADDRRALARLVQGLAIRIAKRLNRVMGKRGAVFADRYHSRLLRTPTEVRNTLVYVLQNARTHLVQFGHKLPAAWTDDEFSSAPWFGGWATAGRPPRDPPPVAAARTWLLGVGWLRRGGGRLRRDEVPRG
jgi:REP element-mobilizing transposase RayT